MSADRAWNAIHRLNRTVIVGRAFYMILLQQGFVCFLERPPSFEGKPPGDVRIPD